MRHIVRLALVWLIAAVIEYVLVYASVNLDLFFNPWLRSIDYQGLPWWTIFTSQHYGTLTYLHDPTFFMEIAAVGVSSVGSFFVVMLYRVVEKGSL